MQQQCFKCHQCQRYGIYECTYRTVFQTEMSNRQTHFFKCYKQLAVRKHANQYAIYCF